MKEMDEQNVKDEVENLLNTIKTEIRDGLKNTLGDNAFGVKIEISKAVPPNEIWFVDASGRKHVIENVKFESFSAKKLIGKEK